ncbi:MULTISPECIES: Uma2 family endonuclease [unclassified Coleofasciculus]|uniref:Uma2 family endonuclease n=1 Tax=unclassified Coleofasciculus TaxID=2692782 RepID=UPI0018810E1A|nr:MULTISPECIES: Uma2 family endonuclease [unclassified Coleofasciculus]MBE9128389.1 Uma2 family endonuclease [Coleofasciculus sp. LEGE 07081]MBE9147909.1 Uma2 family endonuclease [Coleofasciculus sp. LEGE 07092]
MVSQLQSPTQKEIIYPESDGQPMANNTKQFRWIVVIQQNLDWLFADNANVFVAGDLFWYPVEEKPNIVNAPDVMVVFGRPKGDRGSYRQWHEGGIAPQVVFEILSPGNTQDEMDKKLLFYDRYGVEEYYIYDRDSNRLRGWLRGEDGLDVIPQMADWVSPRLQIRFALSEETLELYRPDGERFLSYVEIAQRFEEERQRAAQAEQARQDAVPRLLGMGLSVEQVAEALGLSVDEVQAIAQG